MRKILVIVLMVGLIPFVTGCRIDGLWGFDEGDGATTAAGGAASVTSVKPSVKLPKTVAGASIRAANLDLSNATCYMYGKSGATYTMTITASDTTTVTYTAATNIPTTDLSSGATSGNYAMSLKIYPPGLTTPISVVFEVTSSLAGTTAAPTVAPVTTTLSFSLSNSTGTVTYTYTVAYIPAGTTTATAPTTTTATQTAPVSAPTTTLPSLYVEKVTVTPANSTTEATLGATTVVTDVPFDQPVFKIYFSNAIAAIPTTYSVTAKKTSGTSVTVTFSNSDNGLATMSLSTDKKVLSLTVYGQTGSTKLDPYSSYDVTFNSATITSASNATVTATIAASSVYKLQIKKAALVSWDAKNSASTTVKSGTSPVYVTTAAHHVELTFDYGVTLPTDLTTSSSYTFKKVVGSSTVTGVYKDYFQAPTQDSTKKVVTILFKTGKTLTAGSYTITFVSGSFTDTNSNALDTSSTVTFTVQ
ncbi:hypothetical protein HYY75_10990 [bacterium]|nr:hypothetical protein [bacterium]